MQRAGQALVSGIRVLLPQWYGFLPLQLKHSQLLPFFVRNDFIANVLRVPKSQIDVP